MLRLTFVYESAICEDGFMPAYSAKYITNEFTDEHMELAQWLRKNDKNYKHDSLYDTLFEADDLIDFQDCIADVCGEICDDAACGSFA
jgi:hypothetical protein